MPVLSVGQGKLCAMAGSGSQVTAIRRERFARHGLATRPAGSALEATARTTAIQAQDLSASYLGLRARADALTSADVTHAIDVERSVVRSWLLRATIHLVAATDLPWLVRLVGPYVQRRYATRWDRLGLTTRVRTQIETALPEILAEGPRTRAEILAALAERGVGGGAGPDGELHVHAIVSASSTGLICRGPDRGRTSTFVLTDDWLPGARDGLSGDDALAELARRYFAAYSPATAADFACWSKLGGTRAVALIRDELTEVDIGGRAGFRWGEAEPARGVRLLPAFDNYLLGYAERSALIADEHYAAVFQGGMIKPTLAIDGTIAGVWSVNRATSEVLVRPFGALPATARRAVEREVADVGGFLGLDLHGRIEAADA